MQLDSSFDQENKIKKKRSRGSINAHFMESEFIDTGHFLSRNQRHVSIF